MFTYFLFLPSFGVTVRKVFNLLMLWGHEDNDPKVLDDFAAVGFF